VPLAVYGALGARPRVARECNRDTSGTTARHARGGPREAQSGRCPDMRRPEVAADVNRWTILTEAGTRRECALAYRATVDAVYAEAGPGLVAPPAR
jgi:hypothetical protein